MGAFRKQSRGSYFTTLVDYGLLTPLIDPGSDKGTFTTSAPHVYLHHQQWAGLVGLPTNTLAFSDVYGLDDEVSASSPSGGKNYLMLYFKLLAFVPQPVKAVLLVFPLTKEIDASRRQTDEKIVSEGQVPLDPNIFFVKQTVIQSHNE